jgi:uncharacterized protein YecE (DUF72 family)
MSAPPGDIRIGVSGWTYSPWRGFFFPPKLPQRLELPYASATFRVIEINGTFYRLQRPASYAQWAENTPDDFIFTVKGPRFITHMKRLREPEIPLANFFASGVLRLGDKLGPILWQFPPNFKFDAERMTDFMKLLPRDTDAATRLARKHDERFNGKVWLAAPAPRAIRHAIEIRHESFRTPEFVDLLRAQDVALVCADTVKWPRLMDVTTDFVYCRLHGSRELYRSGYTAADLDCWTARVRAWAAGKRPDGEFAGQVSDSENGKSHDVFVFFDNTDKRHAPKNAASLMRRLGQKAPAYPRELSRIPIKKPHQGSKS